MLKRVLKFIFPNKSTNQVFKTCDEMAPNAITFQSKDTNAPAKSLPFMQHTKKNNGFTLADWNCIDEWLEANIPVDEQTSAWELCQKTWLLHLRDNFNTKYIDSTYTLIEGKSALLLSTLEPRLASATLIYLERARKRILHSLQGVAKSEGAGKDLLIICEDIDQYYDYISEYGSDDSESILSSGVFINRGCGHFVIKDSNLSYTEPVIIHELTHSYLAHLDIPLWLNEGIAVNTEESLTWVPKGEFTPQEMHQKHLEYWTSSTIQHFWSGKAFHNPESSLLAYDLAATLIKVFAKEWGNFAEFTNHAHWHDAGKAAALKYLNVPLGEYTCHMFGADDNKKWEPLSIP